MQSAEYNKPEYIRSRGAYKAACTFEYMIYLLIGDSFLAKLFTYCGISDSLVGIILSFVSLAYVIQFFSLFFGAVQNPKRLAVTCSAVGLGLNSVLFFLPFLPFGRAWLKPAIIICVLVAYACRYLTVNIYYKWANSFVAPERRGRYSAGKEMISLAAGSVFSPLVGLVFDRFEAAGQATTGFLVLGGLAFFFTLANLVSMLMIAPAHDIEQAKNTSGILSATLGNRAFRAVLLYTAVYNFGKYLTIGFLGTFRLNDLSLSVFTVQLFAVSGVLLRIVTSRPFGKYSDKASFSKGIGLSVLFDIASFACIMFTGKGSWFLIIGFSLFEGLAAAGNVANSYNIVYSYVEADYISEAMALKNCIGGLCGFAGSLIGGRILSAVQQNGNHVLGLPVFGQQLLAALSVVLLFAAYLINKFAVGKFKVMKQ